MHAAIGDGSADGCEAMNYLIEKGADVNGMATAPSFNGHTTALHIAAHNGNAVKVKVLLAAGANKSAVDERGRTPAELNSYSGEVRALLSTSD